MAQEVQLNFCAQLRERLLRERFDISLQKCGVLREMLRRHKIEESPQLMQCILNGSSCENDAVARVDELHGVVLFADAVLDALTLNVGEVNKFAVTDF